MSVALIREHYDYHRWANRLLFDLAAGLGDAVTRDMGKHWSFPTLKGTFAQNATTDSIPSTPTVVAHARRPDSSMSSRSMFDRGPRAWRNIDFGPSSWTRVL